MRRDNRNIKRIENKLEITATYKVNRSDELLEFLLKKCNTSRNNVKKLLSNHQVLVNGSVVTQFNLPLAKDDEIKISKNPVTDNNKKSDFIREKRKFYTFNVLYEDDDFIAIDKPHGLLSVESDKETECAFSYVLQYLQNKNKALRPFVLHRIDKETSGVLVFAKNTKIHSMLKLNWNEYVRVREYTAVVEGVMEEKNKTISSYLFENTNNLVYSSTNPNGQKAITHYTVLKQNPQYSLLKVNIDTGRKNQIRVHMQELGHPIVGDDKYGCTKNPFKRLGLHASKLEFIHPITKELISISAPVPGVFKGPFEKDKK
ncbi:MAG: RluA family pseudouridine synthase [Acholeplasmatales bacterium]|nr:RluA family pseudouridine synthase [Acholeplasmatales bacterium]